ncbi:MAG: serine protease [Actinobacteria bacterium]|nr:serine protease [Actinomycetota bacterium]
MKILISVKTQIIFTLTFLIIALTAITGCSTRLSIAEEEIKDLKIEIAHLEKETEEQNEQLSEYDILTGNLNKLLTTVFYGSAAPETEGREKNFTAFSIFYKDNFYLITAGHCIEYEGIRYTDFKFKSNTSSRWIYPELLYYEADYLNNRDYAIFTLSRLRTGLVIDDEDTKPQYVLGNFERRLNFFKEFDHAAEGESGSPILSSGCKLVGIVIKNNMDYTPISEVTRTIDRLSAEQESD